MSNAVNLLVEYQQFYRKTGMGIDHFCNKAELLDGFGDADAVHRFAGMTEMLTEDVGSLEAIREIRKHFVFDTERYRFYNEGVISLFLHIKQNCSMPKYKHPYIKVEKGTIKQWRFYSEKTFLDLLLTFCYAKNDPMTVATRFVMFANENHRMPAPEEIEYSDVLIEKYGDWECIPEELGLVTLTSEQKKARKLAEKKAYWAYKIREKAEELGRAPRFYEMDGKATTISRLFGSWNNALIYAGLDAWDSNAERDRRETITSEMIQTAFVSEAIRIGHLPSATEFKYSATALKRFEKWDWFVDAMLEFAPDLKDYLRPARGKRPTIAAEKEISKFVRKHNLIEVFKDGDRRIAMVAERKAAAEMQAANKKVFRECKKAVRKNVETENTYEETEN